MSAVSVDAVSKNFGTVAVLHSISLTVEQSSFVTLLGPSGCGKTTLLRLIAGLEVPNAGRIVIGSRVVTAPEADVHIPAAQRNVGMVFQSYALWPHKRIWENVAHPLRVRKVDRNETKGRVMEALRLVQLEHLWDRFPGELSGGQQQRVALARAIVYEPDVLLLDEPLSNLDAKLRAEMRYEIRELQRRCSLTTVYVTHDQEEAFAISDRVCLMNNGALEQMGEGLELYENPLSRFTAEFVGAANQLVGRVIVTDRDGIHVRIGNDWTLRARATGSRALDVGTDVSVLIRPHDLKLESLEASNGNGIRALVKATTYLGGATEYVVEASQHKLRARELGRPRFVSGQPVLASVGDLQSIALAH
ncbi:MAG TPA: ABC transporter ATP-binding protein [Casimicrobiaceae bacterium]|nr:ABC transporter ATP-binding protein [Casimicrobiaceae bacterium]